MLAHPSEKFPKGPGGWTPAWIRGNQPAPAPIYPRNRGNEWEEVRTTKEQLDGAYYYLDNIGRGLIPARIFGTDDRAIQAAADYEAVLYKYLYENGQRIATSILYEPGESEEDTEYDD